MGHLTIDGLVDALLRSGVVRPGSVLDGSLDVVDVSRRNCNYRATWDDGAGILLKQPDRLDPGSATSLRNEAEFYAACARTDPSSSLAIPRLISDFVEPPALALVLLRDALTLPEFRSAFPDSAAAHAGLGAALGTFHRFASNEPFASDSYAAALSARAPFVLGIHKPVPALLRSMSSAQYELLKVVQSQPELGGHLERLAGRWEASTVIHGDLKGDNVLVSDPDATVTLVDWELAQRGDPAWDLGAVLQDLLTSWLDTVVASGDAELLALLAQSPSPLGTTVQPAVRSFWRAYLATAEISAEARDPLLLRAIECSAAQFILRAYERSEGAMRPPGRAIAMLQIAANVFAAPARASLFLYGVPMSSRRRAVAVPP